MCVCGNWECCSLLLWNFFVTHFSKWFVRLLYPIIIIIIICGSIIFGGGGWYSIFYRLKIVSEKNFHDKFREKGKHSTIKKQIYKNIFPIYSCGKYYEFYFKHACIIYHLFIYLSIYHHLSISSTCNITYQLHD